MLYDVFNKILIPNFKQSLAVVKEIPKITWIVHNEPVVLVQIKTKINDSYLLLGQFEHTLYSRLVLVKWICKIVQPVVAGYWMKLYLNPSTL